MEACAGRGRRNGHGARPYPAIHHHRRRRHAGPGDQDGRSLNSGVFGGISGFVRGHSRLARVSRRDIRDEVDALLAETFLTDRASDQVLIMRKPLLAQLDISHIRQQLLSYETTAIAVVTVDHRLQPFRPQSAATRLAAGGCVQGTGVTRWLSTDPGTRDDVY